jgi:hypothetical protein
MTDNEIIKALEICSTYKARCKDCPAFVKVDRSNCKQVLVGALNIINRQKAENSNLTSDLTSLKKDLTSSQAEIERLKGNAPKVVLKNTSNSRFFEVLSSQPLFIYPNEKTLIELAPNDDYCIVCGKPVPEGRRICPMCEKGR